MENETVQALNALADKLDTTAGHLWEVLLRQAPITATIEMGILVIGVIVTAIGVRYVMRKTTPPGDDSHFIFAEWRGEGAFLAWACVGVLAVTVGIYALFAIDTMVTVILNPEYWALEQILKQ